MCHIAFWLVKGCLYWQGEAGLTSEHHPGQRMRVWMKLDLSFVSSIFCCLQRLFARWQVSHGLSLGISDSRLENKPKPTMLSQMDGQNWLWFLCWCLYMQAQLRVLDCRSTGGCTSDRQWSLGRHSWHVWALMHLQIQPSWSRDLHPALLTCKRVGKQRIVSAEKSWMLLRDPGTTGKAKTAS